MLDMWEPEPKTLREKIITYLILVLGLIFGYCWMIKEIVLNFLKGKNN